ncbi:MAG: hypothetical protein U0736_09105 [Gemmataceae bacterium]
MITITFPDREVEKRALAFLLGTRRYLASASTWSRSGPEGAGGPEHLVQ